MAKIVRKFKNPTKTVKLQVKWRNLPSSIEIKDFPSLVKELILSDYEENVMIKSYKNYRVNFVNKKYRHIILFDNSSYVNRLRDVIKDRRDLHLREEGWTVTRIKINGPILA